MFLSRKEREMIEEKIKHVCTEEVEKGIRMLINDVCKVKILWSLTTASILVRIGSSRTSEFREHAKVDQYGNVELLDNNEISTSLINGELKRVLLNKGLKLKKG